MVSNEYDAFFWVLGGDTHFCNVATRYFDRKEGAAGGISIKKVLTT